MFNFLNTNSIFWLNIFRLDNLGATFTIECSSLPDNIRHRIENSLSSFSSKVDAFNVLTVSALEFYLINFLLLLHDNKTNVSLFLFKKKLSIINNCNFFKSLADYTMNNMETLN